MVGAVEGDDPRLPRREQCGAKPDLDRVLPGHAELRRQRQPLAEPRRHRRLGQIAQRVHHLLLCDRRLDARVPVPQHRDAEPRGQVEVLAPARVDDATTFRFGPNHAAREPFRRGTSRCNVSAAM